MSLKEPFSISLSLVHRGQPEELSSHAVLRMPCHPHWRGFLGAATISRQGGIRKGQHIHATGTCILEVFVTQAQADCNRVMRCRRQARLICKSLPQTYKGSAGIRSWFSSHQTKVLWTSKAKELLLRRVSSLVCKITINKVWWQHPLQ